jgi:hypothetical protein
MLARHDDVVEQAAVEPDRIHEAPDLVAGKVGVRQDDGAEVARLHPTDQIGHRRIDEAELRLHGKLEIEPLCRILHQVAHLFVNVSELDLGVRPAADRALASPLVCHLASVGEFLRT